MTKAKIWNWMKRYPLWYLGVIVASLIALCILLPYRLFNEIILRRHPDLSGWGFVLCQFTEEMYRTPAPYKKPKNRTVDTINMPGSMDINSMYPSTLKYTEKDKNGNI